MKVPILLCRQAILYIAPESHPDLLMLLSFPLEENTVYLSIGSPATLPVVLLCPLVLKPFSPELIRS